VDHYALDARWEAALRPHAKRIMVIDDLGDRRHDCDLLLDSSLSSDMEQRYSELVPGRCAKLLGPSWALLQPEYGVLHPRAPPRLGSVQRILISFGGVDQDNVTGTAVAAVLALQRDDIVVDVVLSSRSQHAATVRAQVEHCANFTLHDTVPCLARLMLAADLALGAGGMTSWERCCLGLPALVITLANNQRHIAGELHRQGMVQWLGQVGAVTAGDLAHALHVVIDNPCALEPWSRRCLDLLDAQGARRVASILALDADTPLLARPARLRDEALLLRWANDPLVRQRSFNSKPITVANHRRWFYSRLRNEDGAKTYIVDTEDGLPVGVVRFDNAGDGWEIGIAIDAAARGRRLGAHVLEAAMSELRADLPLAPVFGRVKHENAQSQALFESLGFTRTTEDECLVYLCTL
jgi:UDP-2,4-diacetamido-2,4,6-trideoxy-beta-L-altropyranose hydrolase